MSSIAVPLFSARARSSFQDGFLPLDFVPSEAHSNSDKYCTQISIKCCICREVFVFETVAIKPNTDPVCFECILKRKPTRRVRGMPGELFERTSSWKDCDDDTVHKDSEILAQGSCESRKRRKMSKHVRFQVGELVLYPGHVDPKLKSWILLCPDCGGSLNIRSAQCHSSRKKRLVGPMRIATSRIPSKAVCKDCSKRPFSSSWNTFGRILSHSFQNIISPCSNISLNVENRETL